MRRPFKVELGGGCACLLLIGVIVPIGVAAWVAVLRFAGWL